MAPGILTLAAVLLQQQAGGAHVIVARQVTDTVRGEGRALLGPPASSADPRQLLSKATELWDAQQQGKPVPQPQPQLQPRAHCNQAPTHAKHPQATSHSLQQA